MMFVTTDVAIGVVTGVVIEENYSKFPKIKIIKKYRKTMILSGFTVPFGGDKRDRTADLLNAIHCQVVDLQGFFVYE